MTTRLYESCYGYCGTSFGALRLWRVLFDKNQPKFDATRDSTPVNDPPKVVGRRAWHHHRPSPSSADNEHREQQQVSETMDTLQPAEKRQRISYNSHLASFRELNILLVGTSDLSQPFAAALLQVQFDRYNPHDNEDAAVSALKRQCLSSLPIKRYVHTAEEWSEVPQNTRMDHIVVLVSPSNVDASLRRLTQAASILGKIYVELQRVSVLLMMEPVHGYRDAEPITSRLRKKRRKESLFAAPVPSFPCQLRDRNSHLAVSRIILQRIKLGTRQGSSSMPCVSPLLFANY